MTKVKVTIICVWFFVVIKTAGPFNFEQIKVGFFFNFILFLNFT